MNKKIKTGLIVAVIYFVLAVIVFFILPNTYNQMPSWAGVFYLIVFLASFIGVIFTSLAFNVFLPHNLVDTLCKPDQFFPSCNADFGIFISAIANALIYFLVAYIAVKLFLGSSDKPVKARIYVYIFLIIVVILFYLFLRSFF